MSQRSNPDYLSPQTYPPPMHSHTTPMRAGSVAIAAICLFNGIIHQTVAEVPDPNLPHGNEPDNTRQVEHLALFELVPEENATHRTVSNGPWFSESTWENGEIPGRDDRVLIRAGHSVSYNGISDEPIHWTRVMGELRFLPSIETRLTVETLIVDPSGALILGTETDPIADGAVAEIVIDTTRGPIDQTEDPFALSRGVITHGHTEFHGETVVPYTALEGDALAGANRIRLRDGAVPDGWSVGDTLVIAGTEADFTHQEMGPAADDGGIPKRDGTNQRFKDEIVEITAIDVVSGKVEIAFRNMSNENAINAGLTSLLWDHRRPDGILYDREELEIHVANLSRNVVIRSSDAGVDNQERGHFMVMHSRNVQIRNALFKDLGRTDKSILIDDPAALGQIQPDDPWPATGTNPRGRYGLHLHRIRMSEEQKQDPNSQVPTLAGNVVWGTPGWGLVHHDSHAHVTRNVVFDIIGAGIVAEDGNETGLWEGNLVIKSSGSPNTNLDNDLNDNRLLRFDMGHDGQGYWIQGGGAGLHMRDNVAVSCNGVGFELAPTTGLTIRPVGEIPAEILTNQALKTALMAHGISTVNVANAMTAEITGTIVYNSYKGTFTWLHKRNDDDKEHRLGNGNGVDAENYTLFTGFKFWNVASGIHNQYSTALIFSDGLIVGSGGGIVYHHDRGGFNSPNARGYATTKNSKNAHDIHFHNLRVEGFEYGFPTYAVAGRQGRVVPWSASSLTDSEIAGVVYPFTSVEGKPRSTLPYHDLFMVENIVVTPFDENEAPVADFTSSPIGGYAHRFDASSSYDSDPAPQVETGTPGIVSYAWDFDQDGKFDKWGMTPEWNFGSAGSQTVTLTVYDSDGATAEMARSIEVTRTEYPNPLVDGSFDQTVSSAVNERRNRNQAISSKDREAGWLGTNLQVENGRLIALDNPKLAQLFRDDYIRQGEFELTFRIWNAHATGETAPDLFVSVYGVDGQFDLDVDNISGTAPSTVYENVLPMTYSTLAFQNVGGEARSGETLSIPVDLGNIGYEYIVVHFSGAGYDIAAGDSFALDDVQLVDTGLASEEAEIDFGGMRLWETAPTYTLFDSLGERWLFDGDGATELTSDHRSHDGYSIQPAVKGGEFHFGRVDGSRFDLVRLDIQNANNATRTYTMTGTFADSSQQTFTFTLEAKEIVALQVDWTDLVEVHFDNGNSNGHVALDNLVVR